MVADSTIILSRYSSYKKDVNAGAITSGLQLPILISMNIIQDYFIASIMQDTMLQFHSYEVTP